MIYAGEELTTGPQAKAYADHFIAVHLEEIGHGQPYATLSAELQKDPTNQALAREVELVFRGTTLRGLLLEAYAFSVIGEIAMWAAIASFILAAIMLVLSILGVLHLRRTNREAELKL